jgi:hypothetical protein
MTSAEHEQTSPFTDTDRPLRADVDERLGTAALAGIEPDEPARDEPQSFAPSEGTAALAGGGAAAADERPTPLFANDEAEGLRSDWSRIQASFVDEPRKAVEDADNLVATAMKRLAEAFASERAGLEGQWDRGDDVSTEDLRLVLRKYRSFFDRLLKV